MADKSVGELIAAKSVTTTDLFVLEQNGTAKKLTGQVLENWLVSLADGHGGIQSVVKLSTSGLVDTYRITLADTTTFDFMVTNGKSIKSISKASTSGLVDTYRITFNDSTSSTFTVTNGEKGDKGDTAYIWIKYASQDPTVNSNSFGDVPDDWIGVYFGFSSSAPTDWKQYKWYRIKGEKGDTGAPAALVSSQITYQVGDSGTIIPSGSWSESIPPVPQGKYLWTKEVTQFNTGNPITKYSVSRFGIDGSGSVSTVAGVSPNADGNVPLSAADVKALPIGGGAMEGSIDMNGQKLSGLNAPKKDDEAATKGYVDTNKVDKTNVVNNFTTTEEGFVADARALKTLLEKLNEAMTVHRVDITPENGQNYLSYGGTYYQYTKNMFNVHIGVSGLSTEFKTLFQLPTKFWPKNNVTMVLGAGDLSKKSQVIINSSGTVSGLSEDGYCSGDVFYFYEGGLTNV